MKKVRVGGGGGEETRLDSRDVLWVMEVGALFVF